MYQIEVKRLSFSGVCDDLFGHIQWFGFQQYPIFHESVFFPSHTFRSFRVLDHLPVLRSRDTKDENAQYNSIVRQYRDIKDIFGGMEQQVISIAYRYHEHYHIHSPTFS